LVKRREFLVCGGWGILVTFLRVIFTTYSWPTVVNLAKIIFAELLTASIYFQIPVLSILEKCDALMQNIPKEVIVVLRARGGQHIHAPISATKRGLAVLALCG
jgi:hypothetical protein